MTYPALRVNLSKRTTSREAISVALGALGTTGKDGVALPLISKHHTFEESGISRIKKAAVEPLHCPRRLREMPLQPDNFLSLPDRYSDYARSKYAVLSVPYDSTVSFQVGTRHGPRAIITSSQQVELFDEEYEREFFQSGIATLPPLFPNMAGPEPMHHDIFAAARKVVRDSKTLITLGGEHSITSALVRAVMARHKNLSVLQIDAHADLRDEYEGTKYSHAAVMRRVLEYRVPVVPVGIRNYSLDEHRFMKKRGFRPITARETRANVDWIMQAVDSLTENVYVTVDIDGFDPAYAPGTGTPEPGGLDWYQVTDLLKAVAMSRRIVAFDVVEVSPLPGSAQTEFLAAKLIYKLIAHMESNGPKK